MPNREERTDAASRTIQADERTSASRAHTPRPGTHTLDAAGAGLAPGGWREALSRELTHAWGGRVGGEPGRWVLDGLGVLTEKGDSLELRAPSRFAADLAERQVTPIVRAAEQAAGRHASVPVRVVVADGPRPEAGPTKSRPAPTRPSERRKRSTPPHQRWSSFQTYLVGESNRVAVAAGRAVATGDPSASNPLLIHGPCGTGKTHLLQAIARHAVESQSVQRAVFITAERFTSEYIDAVRKSDVPAFHAKYRRVDLLCLDDVHYLATKGGTQAELVFTFDTLRQLGTPVVLASDAPPSEMPKLSAALRSRLSGGAVVGIDSPDPSLRAALLQRLTEKRGVALDDAAQAEVLAVLDRESLVSSRGVSARDIEGIAAQLSAAAPVYGQAGPGADLRMTASAVAAALSQRVRANGAGRPGPTIGRIKVRTIIDAVCEALEVDPRDVLGASRHKRVVQARSMASYLARRLTTQSFPEIAADMNRSTHSTVLTAARRFGKQADAGDVVCGGCAHAGRPLATLAAALERRLRLGS